MDQNIIILIAVSVISVITAFFTFKRHNLMDKTGALVILASVLWVLGVALEMASTSYSVKVFWSKTQFVGMAIVPTGWFIYALQYVGHEKWVTRRNLALLSVAPLACLILVFTNETHSLIFSNATMSASNPFSPLDVTYGSLFWVFLWYTYTLLIFASLLSVQMLIRSRRLYRRQITALLITTVIPWVSSAIFCFDFGSLPFNLTPLAYAMVGVVLVWINPSRLHLEDIIPVARDVVIDRMSDGVFVVDEQNRLLDLNSAAREIIGYSSKDAIGMKANQLLPFWHSLIENAQGLRASGKEVMMNDRIYDIRISSLQDWRGRLNCQVIVLRDITDHKRIEEELRRYSGHLEELVEERTKEIRRYSEELEEIVKERTRELREAERLAAIGELAAMVGHDLRNPLTGIAGAAYVIKTNLASKMDGKIKEMLEIIEKDVVRSNKIISDLLDYSKDLQLELKEASFKQIINEALITVGIPENIDVVNEVNSELKMKIDIEQMKRVFINIIKNAIDAVSDGGKIVIKSEEKEGNLKVSFSDTGKGIPENIMIKLWKPLFTTKAKGMGFGLSICKRIVEAHEGKIFIESAVSKGTTVTIVLPIITNLGKQKVKAPTLLEASQSRS